MLVLTPLAFGTTDMASLTALQVGITVLAACFVSTKIWRGRLEIPNPALLLLFGGFALFVLLQMAPMPFASGERIVQLISGPNARWPFPFQPRTWSVYAYATRQAWLVLLSYLGFFLFVTGLLAQPAFSPDAGRRIDVYTLAQIIIFCNCSGFLR